MILPTKLASEVDPGFGTTGLAALLYAPATEGAGYDQEGTASEPSSAKEESIMGKPFIVRRKRRRF